MSSIGDNLKRSRLLKNLSLKKAGDLLGMSATAVSKYEKGIVKPDSKKLIEFANAYGVKSLDLLKVYNVPQMKFDSFRRKKRLTGKNLQLLESLIQDEVAKYLEVIEISNIYKKVELQKYVCNSFKDIDDIVDSFRNCIGVSSKQPISNLINILEKLGIIIIQIKNPDNRFKDFDGLSEVVNGIPVIVLLDGIKDGARQRFTIAHELGHLLLDIKKELDYEKVCNRFASSLLMPRDAVISEFGVERGNISFFELVAFKEEYKVSYRAILYRLKDLKIISEYLYKKLSIELSKQKNISLILPEKSYQFKKRVHKLEIDKIISINKACELLGVSINEYNKENYYY